MKSNPWILVLACLWTGSQQVAGLESSELPAEGRGRRGIEALLQGAGLSLTASSELDSAAVLPRSFLVHWVSGRSAPGAWTAVREDAPLPAGGFTLADQGPAAGAPQSKRFPDLSPERLVIAVVSASQQLLAWDVIPDPRLLRAELPDALGELRHQKLYRSETQFWVDLSLPAASEAAELQIYQPVWQGGEFALEPLATMALEGGSR